jgi:RNA polymerase sigma-70 factor (ECF subfamily)
MVGRHSPPPIEQVIDNLTEDETLVRAVQTDFSVFPHLFHRYWDVLHRYCYYRIGSWTDAEDIAQGVMITVSREIEGFSFERGSGNFRSWLFTIAHHSCVDGLRRLERSRTVPIPLDETRLPRVLPPEEEVLMDSTHGWIRHLLTALPPEQAEVMGLRMAELTTAEIARVLGKSDRSVAKLTERARPRLRKLMDEAAGGRHE